VVRDLAGGDPDVDQARLIVRLVEESQCRTHECVEFVHRVLELEAVAGGDDTDERRTRSVASS